MKDSQDRHEKRVAGEAAPLPGRRAPRPPVTRATVYRTAVPALLVALAVVAVIVLLLAGGVLFGIIPYPGR